MEIPAFVTTRHTVQEDLDCPNLVKSRPTNSTNKIIDRRTMDVSEARQVWQTVCYTLFILMS